MKNSEVQNSNNAFDPKTYLIFDVANSDYQFDDFYKNAGLIHLGITLQDILSCKIQSNFFKQCVQPFFKQFFETFFTPSPPVQNNPPTTVPAAEGLYTLNPQKPVGTAKEENQLPQTDSLSVRSITTGGDQFQQTNGHTVGVITSEASQLPQTLADFGPLIEDTPRGGQIPTINSPPVISTAAVSHTLSDHYQVIEHVADDRSIPLLFGQAIYKDNANLLYAGPKTGKTLLSIQIAANPQIQYPAFICLDDYNGGQRITYERLLRGKKALILTMKFWMNKDQEIVERRRGELQPEIIMQCNDSLYRMLQNTTERVYSDRGVNDTAKRKDEITVLEEVVNLLIDEGVDFICIDSLNALFGNRTMINREVIDRLLRTVVRPGITFLLVHHTNKKGEMSGASYLKEAFDNIYHLRKEPTHGSSNEGDILVLEETARYTEPKTITFRRRWNNGVPEYEFISTAEPEEETSSGHLNLADRIKAILSTINTDTITRDDLCARLGGNNGPVTGSIENSLKKLENQGIVGKADGKHWATIIIKR